MTTSRNGREGRRFENVGGRRRPANRSRCQPVGRHASARLSAARSLGHRSVPEGRVGPPDGIAQAPARALALPVRPLQWLDRRRDDDRRGLDRLDGRLGGVLRALPRPAVRRRHARLDQPREDRADRGRGGDRVTSSMTRRPCTTRLTGSRTSAAGTSSTSSRSPSERPTGAATTTSRSRSSARWRWSGIRFPPGSWWGPAPAARARRSAALPASAATRRRCASSTRRTRSSTRPGAATPRRSPAGRRASRASDGSASRRRSCRTSSTA